MKKEPIIEVADVNAHKLPRPMANGKFKKEKSIYNDQCKKCLYLGNTYFINQNEWECRHKDHKGTDIFGCINEKNNCKLFERRKFLGIF